MTVLLTRFLQTRLDFFYFGVRIVLADKRGIVLWNWTTPIKFYLRNRFELSNHFVDLVYAFLDFERLLFREEISSYLPLFLFFIRTFEKHILIGAKLVILMNKHKLVHHHFEKRSRSRLEVFTHPIDGDHWQCQAFWLLDGLDIVLPFVK